MNFPSSTYRIQLNSHYTFNDLKNIIGYLHKLGISTIYASPVTSSVSDSSHGYDVTDPSVINPQIGTLEDFKQINAQLKSLNMNWLQDIVPNHMAFTQSNLWLTDIMERGPYSPYFTYFDINWNHARAREKILVPFLGNDLNTCIEAGEIKLTFNESGLVITYFDTIYPLSIPAVRLLLSLIGEKTPAEESMLINQLQIFIEQSQALGLKEWLDFKHGFINSILFDKVKTRQIQLDECLLKINADKTLLKEILENQHYLLTSWKTSETEMNYRRFFTVNSLICLRIEDENVFNDYHSLIHNLYNEGLIQGVRIDHIDGLYDPKQYVERLRKLLGDECYIIAEKILEYNEDIATDWALQGTSGYEFLSYCNRLLTNKEGAEKLLTFYKTMVPDTKPYQDIVFKNKHQFLQSQMSGELDNLMNYMNEQALFTQEFEWNNMRKALGIVMSSFSVYRIYIDQFPLQNESRQIIDIAFEIATQKADTLDKEIQLLKSFFNEDTETGQSDNRLKFIKRLMQFTGPLAAKGVEDTTFYVYNPLISHNEVGDSPAELAITIDDFHQKMISRQAHNPYSLNATSTHDTKRGEDARMRINVLSELSAEWQDLLIKWQNINQPYIQQIKGRNAPSVNDAHFIYQSLIGSFPANFQITDDLLERSKGFIIKALREAKTETTYTGPNEAYEEACIHFIHSILKKENAFLESFIPFLQKIVHYASIYSLVQTIIKITAPGIPDIYQGSELWELSYVDPDNRRPVDYSFRIQMLDNIIAREKESSETVISFVKEKRSEGAEKLFVTWKTLSFRRNYPELFLYGKYIPLQVTNGERKVIAYTRCHENNWVLVILPVGIVSAGTSPDFLENVTIQLPAEAPIEWHNIFTNEIIENHTMTLSTSNLFSKFPVTVLTNNNIISTI